MQCNVADIVFVIDMDGFNVKRNFFCKELGIIKFGNDEAGSFFFDTGLRWDAAKKT